MSKKREYEYDVCLSFAGEDRKHIAKVASFLNSNGLRIFYDEYEKVALWGKDLYEHLHEVYEKRAHYCVIFISKHYGEKLWTNHERRAAQERAFKQHSEYVLPARFDKTELPGLRDTIGYISLKTLSPKKFAELIIAKIGPRQRANYFPPTPDILFKSLPLDGVKNKKLIADRAEAYFRALRHMTKTERKVVFAIFREGCLHELPENVHIDLDLLRRVTGIAPAKLKQIVGGLNSLGFYSRLRCEHGEKDSLGRHESIELKFASLNSDDNGGDATELAYKVTILAATGFCRSCAENALLNLDFGQLSSATHEADSH